MKSFECNGIWWIPDNPKRKICGKLKFNPQDGLELKTIGYFKDEKESLDLKNYEIILGSTEKGNVTLINCIENQSSGGSFKKTSLYIQIILVGNHFEKKDDIKFNDMTISFLNLDEWAGLSGITDESKDSKDIFYFEDPGSISATVEDLKISIHFLNYYESKRFQLELRQNTVFFLESIYEIHLDEFLYNLCNQIRNFISLGIGKATFPTTIKAGTKDDNSVEIYYAINRFNIPNKQILNRDMFFVLSEIEDFEIIINNWLINYDSLRPVYSAYFGTLNNSKMFLEQEFLSLAQALESYHRRMFGGSYIDEEDYKPFAEILYDAIPSELDSSHKNSLKDRIKYGYEFSLRKRLKEILSKYDSIIVTIISDKSGFINDVTNTRNYYTHLNEEGKEYAVTNMLELDKLTKKLKFLLEICFLEELGFKVSEIEKLTSKDRRYDYIKDSD
jgi:hypothetical protein